MFGRRLGNIIRNSADSIPVVKKLKYPRHLSYGELPRKLKKSERKPWVTCINELKRRARFDKRERNLVEEATLKPPENGLLVKALVPKAHEVFVARDLLYACISKVAPKVHIFVCSLCGEVHVGHPPHKIKTCNAAGSSKSKEHDWVTGGIEHILPVVESFHLYDRVGRAVSHKELLEVDRIPAVVELCIQAGVDLPEFPTRRREFPVYRVAGRIIDYERRFPKHDLGGEEEINSFGFWEWKKKSNEEVRPPDLPYDDTRALAAQGMKAWEKMWCGVTELMHTYAVQTCGYCPEVQVGPKGHRVRHCQAFKHQMRDGQHAWQDATIDDIVSPVYVWHVRDTQSNEALMDGLKGYYGKLPAVVELFAQLGADVDERYMGVMREDVAVPGLEEEKLVV